MTNGVGTTGTCSGSGDGASDRAAGCDLWTGQPPLPIVSAAPALFAAAWRALVLVARRRIRQPPGNVGRSIRFDDGTSAAVYRETVVDRHPAVQPVLLVVCFRLRNVHREWAHRLFRAESELNTLIFAGFPGLVSKLWLRHDQQQRYRGVYEWDGADEAIAYVRALWWVLRLVSEPESIRYAVVPGIDRDQALSDPDVLEPVGAPPNSWWRPIGDGDVSRRAAGLRDDVIDGVASAG
jgi:hypothetical protein